MNTFNISGYQRISLKYFVPFRYFRVLEQACKIHYFIQLALSAVLICVTAFLLTTVRLFKTGKTMCNILNINFF